MKAIVFTEYGSPGRLRVKEVPKPQPKDDEVLVRVHASSINSWDWEFQSGTTLVNRLLFGLFRPKPAKQILGADIAGTVEDVGKNATRFRPGDEVFGDLWDSWGGFAEYACARESSLEPKPANSTFEEAAAVPQAGVLALQGLRKTGQMQPGQKVLINGAGGGVGTFAVQLAKLNGTEVTGVDITHKLEVVRSVGADYVIDYTKEDFTRNGQRYDLILDCHGFRSMFDYKRALSPRGTYAMVGGSVPRLLQALLLGLWGSITGGQKFCLVAEGPNKGLTDLKDLIEAGKVVPVIDKRYKLSAVPEALRYFTEGRHSGKIVVAVET
jgi:NADPH:quinone reductase-like Zn-dependent oxidoreductase